MPVRALETVQLGDLVVAAFDQAARYTADEREVAFLATRVVLLLLRRARKAPRPSAPVTHAGARVTFRWR